MDGLHFAYIDIIIIIIFGWNLEELFLYSFPQARMHKESYCNSSFIEHVNCGTGVEDLILS